MGRFAWFAVTMYRRGCNCVEVTEAFLSKCVLVCDRGGKSFMKPVVNPESADQSLIMYRSNIT